MWSGDDALVGIDLRQAIHQQVLITIVQCVLCMCVHVFFFPFNLSLMGFFGFSDFHSIFLVFFLSNPF